MPSLYDDKQKMNKLRGVIANAQDEKVISAEEAGLVVLLANRFRDDIEKKTRALFALQGELAQLRTNEQIIIDIVNNLVNAQKRSNDRQKTLNEIKQAKEVAKKRKADEEAAKKAEEAKAKK